MDSLQCLSASPLIEANAAIPSHLHPVALRSTTSASSPRIAAASKLVETQLRASHAPSSPPSSSSLASPAEESPDVSRETHLNTSSCGDPSQPTRPGFLVHDVAGLTIENHSGDQISPASDCIAGLQLSPKRFPLLSSVQTPQPARPSYESDPTRSIRMITCAEFAELHDAYIASVSRVDESVVFPWLHCCGVQGTPQAAYFSDSPHARTPPRYRGLTIVSADSEPAPRSTARASPSASGSIAESSPQCNTRDRARTRSLGASSTNSSTSLESAATASTSSSYTGIDSVATAPTSPSTSAVAFDGPEPRASLLRSSLLPQDILERCPHSGQYMASFACPRLPPTVNLRLFRQQPSRYATISDIVVYSEAGMSDDTIALARLIRVAQDQCFQIRGGHAANAIEYNVYVVSEPFEVFEREFAHVVAVDGWGYRRNKVDFFEREREEMAALTRASEIAENVWLGNSADVPLPKEDLSASHQRAAFDERPPTVTSHFAKADQYGNAPFDVCIEAHDQATITSSLQFQLNHNYLDRIQQRPKLGNDLDLAEIIHLEVPSTGQSCSGALSRDKLVRYLVDLCIWVKKIAKPVESPACHGRKVLLHCHDGYTETSLFALSYIMYDLGCTLPEAYLHLQNERNRSFFVYPADVAFLRRVESRIEQELEA
ncbi:hypothetical protein PCANC_07300 [Puccinia coronata f. sp. avenae]|uniref:Tyrosine specific protein phosphatases domain-containing protein n=1 Tax=Puccinia coronata f. sp. avenae TaxID=200324 RepID=A0A2N5VRZ5_9BASI|nr:hypothetical protein PCANC_07300 [Puccinia coronata f. sp. avenae]